MITGIDLSMTSTGLATVAPDGTVLCWTVQSAGHRGDDLATRSARLGRLVNRIMEDLPGAVRLVVIEAPSYGSTGASSWDRAGLWWLLVSRLHRLSVPVALCAPSTRAKYATGRGNADKAAVAAAAARLFPELDIGNADEADAAILAHIGAAWMDYPIGALQRHRDALRAVHFPASLNQEGDVDV